MINCKHYFLVLQIFLIVNLLNGEFMSSGGVGGSNDGVVSNANHGHNKNDFNSKLEKLENSLADSHKKFNNIDDDDDDEHESGYENPQSDETYDLQDYINLENLKYELGKRALPRMGKRLLYGQLAGYNNYNRDDTSDDDEDDDDNDGYNYEKRALLRMGRALPRMGRALPRMGRRALPRMGKRALLRMGR